MAAPRSHTACPFTFALKAAEAGLGAALVPDYACVDSLREGRVVQLNRASVPSRRGYYLVRRPDRADVPAVKVLRDWLLAQANVPLYAPRALASSAAQR